MPAEVYRGPNAVDHFLQNLADVEEDINDILAEEEPLIMNDKTERRFQRATKCHICNKPLTEKTGKVRDHVHVHVLLLILDVLKLSSRIHVLVFYL